MQPELTRILDDARAQIARGDEPDAAALEERVRAVDPKALPQVRRLLAVHRAKQRLRAPAPPPKPQAAPPRRELYRAKPTISANMAVRAREQDGAVVLDWDGARGVGAWDVRIADRPDARSPYTDRESVTTDAPRLELRLGDLPQRISIVGRNPGGRIVQRAVVSGLTAGNWRQKWQQRASAS